MKVVNFRYLGDIKLWKSEGLIVPDQSVKEVCVEGSPGTFISFYRAGN